MAEPVLRDGAHRFRSDVEQIIDASTRAVPAAQLGTQMVRVVDSRLIDDAVAQAVDDAIRVQETQLGRSVRRELGLAAHRRFIDLMEEHQRVVAERREAVRARRAVEKELRALRDELASEQQRLARERSREFALSDEGLRALEAHLREVVQAWLKEQRRSKGSGRPPEMPELERVLGRVIHRVIAKERLQTFLPVRETELLELQALEERIAELNQRLGERERELHELRQRPAGVRAGSARLRQRVGEKKDAVLAVIFNENLKLRRRSPAMPTTPMEESH